jgi:hypothetical protein
MKLKALVRLGTFALVVTALGPVGCGADIDTDYPTNRNQNREIYNKPGQGRESVFGEGGLDLFGSRKNNNGGSGIAVNSFLWRASLDTVSFMPLASADPFGGVIITDWFTPPEQPSERFKVTVYILDRDLRSDGLKVSVFRQVREGAGTWIDAGVKPETSGNFENQILTRARQLRLASLNAAR